jgi:hypothetical protein
VCVSGGCGGGIVRLNVSRLLKIDGTLSVNGQGVTAYAGGGSGGSLYFNTAHFDGSGIIQVIIVGHTRHLFVQTPCEDLVLWFQEAV